MLDSTKKKTCQIDFLGGAEMFYCGKIGLSRKNVLKLFGKKNTKNRFTAFKFLSEISQKKSLYILSQVDLLVAEVDLKI